MSRQDLAQSILSRASGKLHLQEKPEGVDELESCPKCGHAALESDQNPRGWRRVTYVSVEDSLVYMARGEQGECLLVACACCGWRWREPVLEADPREEEN